VAVDVPLPHLDRMFDYLVPESMADSAVPGCRVRVRFSGQLVGGYLIGRAETTEHPGRLAFLHRVVSPEPVLTADIAGLARAVADRYGGTLADVLRLAIPPRHAAAEAAARAGDPQPGGLEPGGGSKPGGLDTGGLDAGGGSKPGGLDTGGLDAGGGSEPGGQAVRDVTAGRPAEDGAGAGGPMAGGLGVGGVEPGPWARYRAGPSFLAALASGRAPRAVWSALPGSCWPDEVAQAAAVAAASGHGVLIVVPDARDLSQLDAALAAQFGTDGHVTLSAQLGPAERYRRWLAVERGHVRVVAGTRSAMFAPVADLGLVIIWDDGDDLHAEPRAPYPHARDVLLLRAHRSGAAALIGGFARTAEAAQLLVSGWARVLAADPSVVRQHAPLILTAGEDSELARDEAARSARIPALAMRTAQAALTAGPVLFQVPRRGYLAAVACQRCHARARCASCGGPLALAGPDQPLRCVWCGTAATSTCVNCGNAGLRALITGSGRTAEELARAFPRVPVRTSAGSGVLAEPAIVIATTGAEPRAPGGYSAAVLLDGWALLGRASLRAAEEALRRWMNAAALVRPRPAGGKVIVVADSGLAVVQALIRWDAAGHAERELAERGELGFPPAVRLAAVSGPAAAVRELLGHVDLPAAATVIGPVPADQDSAAGRPGPEPGNLRFLVRVPWSAGTALAVALRGGLAERSARKDSGSVRIQLDPAELI
jgi:primosomal protein N' (replication factor Y)